MSAVDVLAVCAARIAKANFIEWKKAVRRRAMKRWLRERCIPYTPYQMYSESSLRKLVRNHISPGDMNDGGEL